ncbi:hypothetical protein F4804DRAFT_344892 [Jackrogersella minutella]|nr:hypothetical protein F4804DRAFT_344892 [Jackrogersella minutella]
MPKSRTHRSSQPIFTRPFPAAVVYDLSVQDQATIRVPAGSIWTLGSHWHEAHTEFLQVLAGRARVSLSGRTFCIRSQDGVITGGNGAEEEGKGEKEVGDGEELVVKEWTEPRDGAKEVFFRNINGLILDATDDSNNKGGSGWSDALLTLELWNFIAVTKTLMSVAVALGWVLWCPGVYEEYSGK